MFMYVSCVSWFYFLKSISRWQASDLDYILCNGDLLFKSINKLRYLSIDGMPNKMKIKKSFLTIEYWESKTAEFFVKEYLTTISEIISTCQFRGNGDMLFIIGFTLGIIWNSNNFYLFDSNSRDSSGNPVIDGAVILLKYNPLLYIDEYIKPWKANISVTSRFSSFKIFAARKTFQVFKLTLKETNTSENTRKIVCLKNASKKYHENSLSTLSKKGKNCAGSSRSDWVNKFRRQIFERPSFICTICHTFLYFQSIQKFIETKYEWYKNKNYP